MKYDSDPYWGEKASSPAFKIDYEVSNRNKDKLIEYNKYQLSMGTGVSTVYNKDGQVLYRIRDSKVISTGTLKKSVIMEVSSLDVVERSRGKVYEINPDRTDIISLINITGDYDYNIKGYFSINNTKLINKVKSDSTIYIYLI